MSDSDCEFGFDTNFYNELYVLNLLFSLALLELIVVHSDMLTAVRLYIFKFPLARK